MKTIHLLDEHQSQAHDSGITGDMMKTLNKTAGWLRLLGILGMIIGTLLMISTFIHLFNLSGISASGHYPQGSWLAILFVVLISLIGSIFVSLIVYRYGNNLKKYTTLHELGYLDEALNNNKILWTIIGCFTIIIFTLSVFSIAASLT